MTTDQIVSLIVGICPSVVTILTVASVIIRVVKDFKDLKKQVNDMKCFDDLNTKMGQLVHENYELKKKLNETLTKLDHVERK